MSIVSVYCKCLLQVSIVSAYCECLLGVSIVPVVFMGSIHGCDSLIRFMDSIPWLDALIGRSAKGKMQTKKLRSAQTMCFTVANVRKAYCKCKCAVSSVKCTCTVSSVKCKCILDVQNHHPGALGTPLGIFIGLKMWKKQWFYCMFVPKGGGNKLLKHLEVPNPYNL